MNKVSIYLLLTSIVLSIGALLTIQLPTGNGPKAPVFRREQVVLERADGKTMSLNVEVAETPEQHAYGLMFRRSLPEDAGMLFLLHPPQIATFWMKDTFIPLDMLFVRPDGAIAKIAAKAMPLDQARISSEEPVAAVLEINGGAAERLGVKVGDKVKWGSGFEARGSGDAGFNDNASNR